MTRIQMCGRLIGLLLCVVTAALFSTIPAEANLLQNASFEVGPGGLGILPTDWVITNPSPDTFGPSATLPGPPYFGTTATAHDGTRWVAAYDGFPETFGQTLTSPLTPGQDYLFSAWLMGPDSTIFFDGDYEVWLGPSSSGGTQLMGSVLPTTGPNVWEFRSMTFTAPVNAASLPFLELRPYATTVDAYVGLDSVSLVATSSVPEPSTRVLGAMGLVAFSVIVLRRASVLQRNRALR